MTERAQSAPCEDPVGTAFDAPHLTEAYGHAPAGERVCPIAAGSLRIRIGEARMPLDALLGFATRANPRRPFLFVSKILGRHVPCTPLRMRESVRMLAEGLAGAPGPLWTIAMAETATGLGAGIADTLARTFGRDDTYYQHTTRLPLAVAPLATFEEGHSHATTHSLYPPLPQLRRPFEQARTLAVVDDEISTGNSIASLIHSVLPFLPRVERLAVLVLVDWLGAQERERLAASFRAACGRPLQVEWHSLLSGTFVFEPHPAAPVPAFPSDIRPRERAPLARDDLGRRGVAVPLGGVPVPGCDLGPLDPGCPVAVVGAGECAFEPFLLAESLGLAGHPTTVQCISRSPVLLGGAVVATLPSPDPYREGVGYYLHNPPPPRVLRVGVFERPDFAWERLDGGRWVPCAVPAPAGSEGQRGG